MQVNLAPIASGHKDQENGDRADSNPLDHRNQSMPQEIVDGQAMQNLRRQFGISPAQLARVVGLKEAQILELENGGATHFTSPEHKIRCALKVASSLSGVQANGLPRRNVFHVRKKRRAFGDKPKPVAPTATYRPVKYEDTPEFYKMLLLIFVVSFLLIGVVMPVLFGTEPPPKVERLVVR